jgi:hypothetical protein
MRQLGSGVVDEWCRIGQRWDNEIVALGSDDTDDVANHVVVKNDAMLFDPTLTIANARGNEKVKVAESKASLHDLDSE